MEYEDLLVLAAATTNLIINVSVALKQKTRRQVRKTIWSRNWLKKREMGNGILTMLNSELLLEDQNSYRNFLRLTSDCFEKLLSGVEERISKQDTLMRKSVSARSRLEVTLRFLATGETFRSLMYSTRIHETTISRFVIDVCEAIYEYLKTEYMKVPSTVEEWQEISDDFYNMWQFPHCLGAMDGRHITFRPPRSDGSYYFNYKGSHSIVLLAVSDANYKFRYVNVGCNGRVSDGGVFRESKLKEACETNVLNFPPVKPLPERNMQVPFVFVADDAFPLSNFIMKPYPNRNLSISERTFNYRLSRARRVVENAFGILANRFRVLLNPISLRPTKVEKITLTCVALHNFLATENQNYSGSRTETNETPLQSIGNQGGNKSSNMSRKFRDEFKDFFCSNGAVPWQDNAINNFNM